MGLWSANGCLLPEPRKHRFESRDCNDAHIWHSDMMRWFFGSGTRDAPVLAGVHRLLRAVRSPTNRADCIAAIVILLQSMSLSNNWKLEQGRSGEIRHFYPRVWTRFLLSPAGNCQPRRFRCRRSWQASLSTSSSRLSTYCLRCFSFSVRPAMAPPQLQHTPSSAKGRTGSFCKHSHT